MNRRMPAAQEALGRSLIGMLRALAALFGGLALLVVALGGFTGEAVAAPTLDPARHAYLALISTDKAFYQPGDAGQITLSLRNPGSIPFTGQISVAIFRNRDEISRETRQILVPAAASLALNVAFTAPASDLRGYRTDIQVRNVALDVVDSGFGSIDVQSGVMPTRFPRQCWASKWGDDVDAAGLAASEVAWRCNIVQAYANYYKPELAPPPGLAAWPSLPNQLVRRSVIADVIAAAHARGMPVLFFQGTREAYDTFLSEKTGPRLEDGSFRRACTPAAPCTEADMDRSPAGGDGWSQYGWQADHLDLFDLCSSHWQNHLLAESIKPMLAQFAFDGWQADTLGPPTGQRYGFNGRVRNPGACLSNFTSSAQQRIGKPVVVNNVSGWEGDTTALYGTQPMLYRETWNFDSPTYAALDALTDGSVGGLRRYTSRAIIQPAYLQRRRAKRCADHPAGEDCEINIASPLLATAMFAIAGSTFMNHVDDGCLATGVFMEGYHLPCSATVVDRLLAYKNFEVAYQPLLRDGVTPSAEPCVVTSGVVAGTTGQADQAYVLGRTKAGFQMCQLLNLRGIKTSNWTDLEGAMSVPTAASAIGMKLYYVGGVVSPEANRLWWASPDANNGAASTLAYTAGSDEAGQYVAFTLPSLNYWSMVVLETSALADGDFHINPYEPIRGSNFGTATNGVGSARTVTTGSCCARWASYAGLDFGSVSPFAMQLLYGAASPASITLRLDHPKGRLIGRCALGPTGGIGAPVSARCAIRKATGRHDLFILFRNRPISLYNFKFVRTESPSDPSPASERRNASVAAHFG